jgi:hypothetical protein
MCGLTTQTKNVSERGAQDITSTQEKENAYRMKKITKQEPHNVYSSPEGKRPLRRSYANIKMDLKCENVDRIGIAEYRVQ